MNVGIPSPTGRVQNNSIILFINSQSVHIMEAALSSLFPNPTGHNGMVSAIVKKEDESKHLYNILSINIHYYQLCNL